jgi:hypothetical protein
MTEKATQKTMALALPVGRDALSAAQRSPKRLVLGVLMGILLPLIHLLFERLGLLLVAERQPS